MIAAVEAATPLGQVSQPDDVADVVAMLAGDMKARERAGPGVMRQVLEHLAGPLGGQADQRCPSRSAVMARSAASGPVVAV
jgi:hypothetical protein